MKSLLSAREITKRFSGVTALADVHLTLQAGKVHAIIGENGAGKSTLMKIVSGVIADYDGTIELNGEFVKFKDTRDAQNRGIAIIHQELNLLPELSVSENIFLGREISNSFGVLDESTMRACSLKLLKKLKMSVAPDTPVKELSLGQQQLIEVAKALLLEAEIIIMDEPSSAISETEIETLFEIIDELKQEGKAIAYISHKLDELFRIADEYTVLRDGKYIGSGQISQIGKDALIRMMAGREIDFWNKKEQKTFPAASDGLLTVSNFKLHKFQNRHPYYPGISFQLRKGEIVGIFGLMGAGRTELLEGIFGLHPGKIDGNIFIENKFQKFKSTSDAVRAGLAFVSEDRKKDGIIPELSVNKNMSLVALDKLQKGGIINKKKERNLSEKYIAELQIKLASPEQLIQNLSGGNQQKAILGKWLAVTPKVLLLDEPTRGIDVHAKSEIYKLMKKLASEGMGILMVSSELPEILAVSDRVLVLSDGRLTGEFSIETATEENILEAAIH